MKNAAQFLRSIARSFSGSGISVTVISDCRDDNARGRMMARLASLLPRAQITFIGVANDAEAALCLVDSLDAFEDRRGMVLLNIAPRSGEAKKWPNGTPFGELAARTVRIFSTVDGRTLGFLQHVLGQKLEIRMYDIPAAVRFLGVDDRTAARIADSQYRSFDFLTRLAAHRARGKHVPYELFSVKDEALSVIGFIDVFGNIKTTIPFDKESFREAGHSVDLTVGSETHSGVKFYSRLKDVPDGELAVIVGSSGLGETRFLEIVVQGGRADERLGYPRTGTPVSIS